MCNKRDIVYSSFSSTYNKRKPQNNSVYCGIKIKIGIYYAIALLE